MNAVNDIATYQIATASLPERDRAAIWREVFGRTNVRLDVAPLDDMPLDCRFTVKALPGLSLACGSSTSFSADRTPELLADNRHDISLLIPLRGRGRAVQSGKEASFSQGDAVVLHTCRTANCIHDHGEYLNVCVPESVLSPLVPALRDTAMTVIPASSEPLRLLLGYCRILNDEGTPTTRETAAIVASHFHDLVASAINSTRRMRPLAETRGLKAGRVKAIRADIARHAHVAELTIEDVARRLHISPRYIRKLLAAENTTFSELVLNERLSTAFQVLTDARYADLSICNIAFDVGFGDLSYFNRTFRKRFGGTPSEIRETRQSLNS